MTCPPPGYLLVRSSDSHGRQWKKMFCAFADGPLPQGRLTTVPRTKRRMPYLRKRKPARAAAEPGTSLDEVARERLGKSLAIAAEFGRGILAYYLPADLENPVDLIDVRDIQDITLAPGFSRKRRAFVVHTSTRKIFLAAASTKELECWISALQAEALLANERSVEATELSTTKANTVIVIEPTSETESRPGSTPERVAPEADAASPSAAVESGAVDSPGAEKGVVVVVPSVESALAEDSNTADNDKSKVPETLEVSFTATQGDETPSRNEEVVAQAISDAKRSDVEGVDPADEAVEGANAAGDANGKVGTPGFFGAFSSLFRKAQRKGHQRLPDDAVSEVEASPVAAVDEHTVVVVVPEVDERPADVPALDVDRDSTLPSTADIVESDEMVSVSRIVGEIVDEALRDATAETTTPVRESPAPRVKKELFRLYVPVWARRRRPVAATA